MKVAAVILAAGGSSRLGRPKQLVRIDGRSLLRRAAETAVAFGCSPVIVVVGRDAAACEAELASLSVTIVQNPDWEAGMGSSLRAGFSAVPFDTDAAFLMLCDQPLVTAETLSRLATGHGDVSVAEYDGTVGPPLLAGRQAIARLQVWPSDAGAKTLWTTHHAGVRRVPCPEAAIDVDTEADVERVTRSAGDAA